MLQEVQLFDFNADEGYARQVVRELQRPHHIDDKQYNELLQGLFSLLGRGGWGACLITASGSTVLMQVVEMAESKYVAAMKKQHGTGNFKAFDREGATEANRQHYPDYDECGVPLQYLMGWALAPPYVCGERLRNFPTVSSVDFCSACEEAQGVYYLRCTHDANGHMVTITVARLLCAEASMSTRLCYDI